MTTWWLETKWDFHETETKLTVFPSLPSTCSLPLVKSCLHLQAVLLWSRPAGQAPGRAFLESAWCAAIRLRSHRCSSMKCYYMMDRVMADVKSVLVLLTWCLLQQVFYASKELTSLENIYILLFVTPFYASGCYCTY